jgi:hypothetical protein
MKCIRNINTKEVRRVSNEQAERQVSTNNWMFCPKSDWKALRVNPVEVIVHTEEQKREIMRRADKRKMQKGKKAPIKRYMEN